MCGYLYTQINYTHYTHIYYVNKHKLLFWMRLIAINRCPSLAAFEQDTVQIVILLQYYNNGFLFLQSLKIIQASVSLQCHMILQKSL